MITFIAAVYNEQEEIQDLISSVTPYVDRISIVDDGSTDKTQQILLDNWWRLAARDRFHRFFNYHVIEHTGLPETVKNEALKVVEDDSWVLMLDADERLNNETLKTVRDWVYSPDSESYDYIYFRQIEIIDGNIVREFQKAKLFRKEAVRFPLENIHADDVFIGNGTYREDWVVQHRKTTSKQIQRETEYSYTYQKLYNEGKIDEGRLKWLQGLHHFVFPKG